ncbi:hypothetical protein ACFLXB_05230 [Chloroflexota bacterium]
MEILQVSRKITILDRILLLVAGLLAAYQVGFGIDSHTLLPQICYTIAFGVVMVASLLIIILGFEILDSPLVVVGSTIIPLFISLGLVAQFFPLWLTYYSVFVVLSFLSIIAARLLDGKRSKVISVIIGHGISGLIIFLSPLILSLSSKTPALFSFVGIGGALIGVTGTLLAFLRLGKPILTGNKILAILPCILLIMMISFIVGFSVLTG